MDGVEIPTTTPDSIISEKENATWFIQSIYNPELEIYSQWYIPISIIKSIFMILGNGIVLILFFQERQNLKIPHKFIVSMAMNDFITGCIFMPLMIFKLDARISADHSHCPTIIAFLLAIYHTSLFVVTASSIDRFWAVVFPIHYRNKMSNKLANCIILLSWLIPWSYGLALMIFNHKPVRHGYVCVLTPHMVDKALLNFALYSMLTNLSVIIVLYCFIHHAILKAFRQQKSKTSFFKYIYKSIFDKETSENDMDEKLEVVQSPKLKAREVRSTLLVLAVVICSVVAFLPGTIHVLVVQAHPKLFKTRDILIIYLFLTINSVVDPILYAFNIKNIKHKAKVLLFKIIFCVEIKPGQSMMNTTSTVVPTGHEMNERKVEEQTL